MVIIVLTLRDLALTAVLRIIIRATDIKLLDRIKDQSYMMQTLVSLEVNDDQNHPVLTGVVDEVLCYIRQLYNGIQCTTVKRPSKKYNHHMLVLLKNIEEKTDIIKTFTSGS